MKVLHVITSISRGGAENHLVDLVAGQIRSGLAVQVAYLKDDGYWTARLTALGAGVTNLGMSWYGDLTPLRALRRLIRSFRPDLVHAHMPPAELYTRLALLGDRRPLVISKHNDEPFYRGFGQRWVAAWVARRAGRVIAISDAVRAYFCGGGLGLPADQVITVRYGIDTDPYQGVSPASVAALRAEWGVSPETLLIGTVARLAPQKALDVLLDGFARYLHGASVPAKLVIVGTGPLREQLEAQAAGLGISDRVIWAGFREDIPVVMNALDLFALTSIYEGFGLVLLEAMAAAQPVVASAVSAIPEIVADGVTGRLVPPREPGLLASAFLELEEPARRRACGEAGRQRARSLFTLERMVAATEQVYGGVLKGRSPGAR